MPLIQDDHLLESHQNNLSLPNITHLRMTATLSQSTRILNRRKHYLELNPEYFSPELESADPLLYDRLIRKHYTPADREIERRQKGYARSLEADLVRSEAKVEEARKAQGVYIRTEAGEIVSMHDDEEELSREEAYERWCEVMERRFLDGKDEDFDYQVVDEDEGLDRDLEERERQEEWFEAEQADGGGNVKKLEGETGVQDF